MGGVVANDGHGKFGVLQVECEKRKVQVECLG